MNRGTASYRRSAVKERSFVSEIFHTLSQPLTALQCSLELSLLRDTSADELRTSIAAALENAESLRQRLMLVRGLNDADDPGDITRPVDLSALLGGLQEEMAPLFESAGQEFQLTLPAGDVKVYGNQVKLTRALFYLLEYLFRYSRRGATLGVTLGQGGAQALIEIVSCSSPPVSPADDDGEPSSNCSCEVEFARRSLCAAGGSLEPVISPANQSIWRAILPLA